MGKRRINCKFCEAFFYDINDYASHIDVKHKDMMLPDMTPRQFIFYLNTGKKHGSCIVCKKDTSWNPNTNKYNRLCENPKCKETYVKTFRDRMVGKYGKTTLLNDPEQQKIMLARRKISGVYRWSDRIHFDPIDIMAPSPHTYYYEYEGRRHFYIPDFFIPSLNLEIEIKDGGDNVNKHPKIQAVDKVKEKLKDELMMKNQFNYLKITNKNNDKFLKYLDKAKENYVNHIKKPIYMIESSDDEIGIL